MVTSKECCKSAITPVFTTFFVMITAGLTMLLFFVLYWAFLTNPWIERSCTVLDHEATICPKKTEDGLGIVVQVDDTNRMVVKRFGKCKWHRSEGGEYGGVHKVKGETCTTDTSQYKELFPIGSTHKCYTVKHDDLQEEICWDYELFSTKTQVIVFGSLTGTQAM
eukprot:TRINITY_DN68068_c3_g10_i3.p1 TRINITY_DN68068_c3_g10~~TRINITY_DN68068_c3_g10_i3.p1  ORF type:complete len:165 (+),score=8.72 TRINITY_DN68068_c3_g10_i3:117-611(+)